MEVTEFILVMFMLTSFMGAEDIILPINHWLNFHALKAQNRKPVTQMIIRVSLMSIICPRDVAYSGNSQVLVSSGE